jgi:hypothetical protein
MNNLKFVLVLLIFFQICNNSAGQSSSKDNSAHSDFNILFIGNSLTYTNNLPELVRNSAKQKGIIIDTKMIAYPNYAIIDHWNDGQVQEEIASRRYNYIIIQQGPSSQPYGKEILIEYGKKYSALCKNNNAQLSYLMVWPSLTYYDTFAGVIKNHQDAASINDAILCPVGQVWKEYFDSTNNFDYYSPDGFHPSLKGSQVAADVIVEYLFQQ